MDPSVVYDYLMGSSYPQGVSCDTKRAIRRAAKNNYELQGGQLYYRQRKTSTTQLVSDSDSEGPKTSNCCVTFGKWRRVLITQEERDEALSKFHCEDGHMGIGKTMNRIQSRYFWPNMTIHIKDYISTCHTCQTENKKPTSTAPPMVPIPINHAKPWHQIGIDLVSMETSKQGNNYICTVVDYFTKYNSAKAIPNKTAQEVAKYLFDLMMIFGFPGVMVSDQGREFCNQLVEQLLAKTGTDHRVTSPYHPQANGMTERFNQTIQNMISKATEPPRETSDWETVLPSCVFAYNTSVHATTKNTPYFLMFGAEATLSGEMATMPEEARIPCKNVDIETRIDQITNLNLQIRPMALDNIEKGQTSQKSYYDRRNAKEHFTIGQKVLKKNLRRSDRKGGKAEKRYLGVYTITRMGRGKGTYHLKDQANKVLKKAVHAMNLKAYKERDEPGDGSEAETSEATEC